MSSALRTAQEASQSATEAAQRAENAAGVVDGVLESTRQAADEARLLAEQATSVPSLGQDANILLERLEDDYQLLTSLVRDLASRISSIGSAAAAQAEPVVTADAEPPSADHEAAAWRAGSHAANGPGARRRRISQS